MAYTLEPLVQILEQTLQSHHQYLVSDLKPQLQSLLEKATSLKCSFEKCSPITSRKMENLEARIRDAAHKAEDIIESHVTDQILQVAADRCSPFDSTDVMEELAFLNEEASRLLDDAIQSMPDHQPAQHATPPPKISAAPPRPDPVAKTNVVGFDDDSLELMHRLTGESSNLQIIPIVGMGGIGKTTLARKLYDDRLILYYFDICAWITISQDYNTQENLLSLLGSLRKLYNKINRESEAQLGEQVYKTLKGRRYFIVVDDIWDTEAWDQIRRYFPDDGNGSRMLLTTRESIVADYASNSSRGPHHMHLLDKDVSWELFCEKVFGERSCPRPELEEIGRNIANNCAGLPLALSVMGGLLSTSDKTLEYWEIVEKNVSSVVAKHDAKFFEILSMSYKHLPYHLKPCFLYVGAFPEDVEIRASKIIKLWIAEGFLKATPNMTILEEVAEAYLKALVDRNLLLVRQQESDGKVKTFGIHDLLRDLCQKKAVEEKFLWFKDLDGNNVPEEDAKVTRRVSLHPSLSDINENEMKSTSFPRSFLCIGRVPLVLAPFFLCLRLLRVLDVFGIEFYLFPKEILQLVNLRYLACTCHSAPPSSISRFRYLQTLIFCMLPSFRGFSLPPELWEMTQLRNIKSEETFIWYHPPNSVGENGVVIQEKLHTLSNILMSGFTTKALVKFPNLRKLGIFCNASVQDVLDLARLKNLERLKCSSNLSLVTRSFLSFLTFPVSLRKLSLSYSRIPWGFMEVVGSLPSLRQLKLQHSDFQGAEWDLNEPELETTEPEWEPTEGEFPQLELLVLIDVNLVHWRADSSHFPSLRRLIIRECCSLKEIPSEIGDIQTLETIEVDECNPSVVASAKQIREEQLDYENDIQVLVYAA